MLFFFVALLWGATCWLSYRIGFRKAALAAYVLYSQVFIALQKSYHAKKPQDD